MEPKIPRRATSLKPLLIRENTDEVQVYDNSCDNRQENGRKLRGGRAVQLLIGGAFLIVIAM